MATGPKRDRLRAGTAFTATVRLLDHMHSAFDKSAQVMRVIRSRRSIRFGFVDKPVPEAVVDDVIDAGVYAPSSKNAQPWCFHVVRDKTILEALADAVQSANDIKEFVPADPATGLPREDWSSTVVESAEVLRMASLCIFIENLGAFSDGRRAIAEARREHLENLLIGYSVEIIGLGAAIENMWLAASAHGLGGVFMGDVLIAEEDIRRRLDMAGDLVGCLALGYSEGRPAGERVFLDGRVVRHDHQSQRLAVPPGDASVALHSMKEGVS